MFARTALVALPFLVTSILAGCAGEGTLHYYEHEGEDGPAFDSETDFGSPDYVDLLVPVIESFVVEPLYLALGGGEVEARWESRDAYGCALLLDDETVALGTQGEVSLALEETSELRMVCIDEQHDDFTQTSRTVVVQAPPADTYDSEATTLDTVEWEQVLNDGKFATSDLAERRMNIEQESRVILTPTSSPQRTAVTIWLAQDSNADGWVGSDEIIAIAMSNAQQTIDIELDAGDYSLFIESDGQSVEWTVDSYILPTSDGSNW